MIAVILGVALGLTVTLETVSGGPEFGAVQAGAWTGWPKEGAADVDPYTRAQRARSGDTPLGLTEGLTFVASADDSGTRFDSRCDYIVRGAVPPTRFWTLIATSPTGALLDTSTRRYEFTSSEIIRDDKGAFAIAVAGTARPGNWLPVVRGEPFRLVLRLYDTPASASAFTLDASQMPSIRRGACA